MTIGSNTSGHYFDTSLTTNGLLYSKSGGVVGSIAAGTSGQLYQSGGSSGPGLTTATYPVTAGTSGNVLTSDGTNWNSTAPSGGSATAFSVVYNSVSSNFTSGALSDLAYDTTLIDTASGISAGVYTVPKSGNWLITVTAVFATTVSFSNCDIFVNKNSGTYLLHIEGYGTPDNLTNCSISGSVIVPLSEGDTLKISVFPITSGSDVTTAIGFSNGYFNSFCGYLLD